MSVLLFVLGVVAGVFTVWFWNRATSDERFDAGAVQREVELLRNKMCGVRYRHFKGGLYVVEGVSARERDGEVVVHYCTVGASSRWTRTYREFFEQVPDGRLRFSVEKEVVA